MDVLRMGEVGIDAQKGPHSRLKTQKLSPFIFVIRDIEERIGLFAFQQESQLGSLESHMMTHLCPVKKPHLRPPRSRCDEIVKCVTIIKEHNCETTFGILKHCRPAEKRNQNMFVKHIYQPVTLAATTEYSSGQKYII